MKAKSAKAKGSRLEHKVAALYRHYEIDPSANRMLLSGGGYLKGDIYKPNDFEYLDECKNQETVSLWKWWNQTKEQAGGNRIPILHVGGNYRPILTIMEVETYMNLRRQIKDLEEELKK
jgi:hypothetical protein